MKKLLPLVLGLAFWSSLFAQLNITTTNVSVNGTWYSCKGSTYDLFETQELGNLASLALDGTLRNAGSTSNTSASMYYRINGVDWLTKALTDKVTISDDGGGARTPVEPGEGGDLSIPGSLMKTLTTYETYSAVSSTNVNTSGLNNGQTYSLDIYYRLSTAYDPSDAPTSYYSATFTKIAGISFMDGTGYTPVITLGNSNEVIGRFALYSDVTGATLTDISLNLTGTRSGFSNIKLWESADNSFDAGSDTQLGSTLAADPGANPAVFSSFSSTIPLSVQYYFVTADVAEDATGGVRGSVADTSAFTIDSGEVVSTVSTSYLSASNAEIPTAITLSSFTAEAGDRGVVLRWTTESETENSHFNLYRQDKLIAQVTGRGTTTMPSSYSFTDAYAISGSLLEYSLADVSLSGIETKHAPVYIEIGETIFPGDFVLESAYPNPFNPEVVLDYVIRKAALIDLGVYNVQGEKIASLVNDFCDTGRHRTVWNAAGSPSGVYVVRLMAEGQMQTRKILLMK